MSNTQLDDLSWRKSSYSAQGECVEVAKLPDGSLAVRNSNMIEAGILILTPQEFDTLVLGMKAGEFDDLI